MGGFSVQCDCRKWFTSRSAYKDHCKGKGCIYHHQRVGPAPENNCGTTGYGCTVNVCHCG